MKIEKMSMLLLSSFMIQFVVRLIQAILDQNEIQNEIYTLWYAVRDVIYLLSWALMFYFLSQMIIIRTLLKE